MRSKINIRVHYKTETEGTLVGKPSTGPQAGKANTGAGAGKKTQRHGPGFF